MDCLPCRGARLQCLRPGLSSRTEAQPCCVVTRRLLQVRELTGCARGRLDLRSIQFSAIALSSTACPRGLTRGGMPARGDAAQTKIRRFSALFRSEAESVFGASWNLSANRVRRSKRIRRDSIIDCLPRREKQAAARKDLRVSRAIDASRSRRLKNGRSCFRSQCRLAA
jgi:hypothetical protein